MLDRSSSIYIRIPFQVEAALDFDTLFLRMRHDAGFVAYLNGVEVARRNAPTRSASTRRRRPPPPALKGSASPTEPDPLPRPAPPRGERPRRPRLNDSRSSPDFLILPELAAARTIPRSYLPRPTPARPTGQGCWGSWGDVLQRGAWIL